MLAFCAVHQIRLSTLIPFLTLAVACGDGPDGPSDSGARLDSGSPAATLDGGHSGNKADAQASIDSGSLGDSGFSNTDAGNTDAETKDALSTSDASQVDAGFNDGGGMADAQTPPDAGMSDSGVLIGIQTGELVITEVMGLTSGLEWIELRNISGTDQDLRQFYFEFDSRPGVATPLFPGNDPTGTSTAPFTLASNTQAYFVLNPTDPGLIPNDAHVYGTPGQFGGNGFQDSGDKITLYQGTIVVDALEMTDIALATSRQITLTQFPLILNQSTQLSSHVVGGIGANANDFASVWCSPIWRGATPGQDNHNCNWFVISEVLYDYDSPTGGIDSGREFVEIAGPVGGYIEDLQVVVVQGSASSAGTVVDSDSITALRMPGNGLYVLADQESAGQTQVSNPDQIVDLQLQNGPDAIQLLRVSASSGVTYFDSFGYGALTPNLTDSAHMQPAYEGTPVADMSTRNHSTNWARSANQSDTQDNAVDFFHDPSPTPGERNEASRLELLQIQPNNVLASESATITFSGNDFTDFMVLDLDGEIINASQCTETSANEIQCTVSFSSTVSAAPLRQDVGAESRPEHGQSASLSAGLTWSISLNGSGDALEADYCNLQHPAMLSMSSTAASELIYGRIYEGGITDVTSGASSSILAELGYGPLNTDPSQSNAWQWFPASFNLEYGNDDEYQSVLNISTPGDYLYTYRFSLDGGLSWTFCDLDGAGSNGGLNLSIAQLGTLNVAP